MKIIYTSFFVLSITGLIAQSNPATPNAGFESWTHYTGYSDPNQWTCLNPDTYTLLGIVTCYQDSTVADVHSGKYSLHLITQLAGSDTVPGTVTTGTFNIISQTISGGLPYTLRPDSIIGWYKYVSESGDNGDIEFYLFGANHLDTIGEAFFETPASSVSTYTRFAQKIIYRSQNAIDTALWILTSSVNQYYCKVGSQLIADDLGLVPTDLGVNNLTVPDGITIGPNPVSNDITINNPSGSGVLLFTLYDVTGRKEAEEKTQSGMNIIDARMLPNGLYIYSLSGEQGSVIITGKIVVQK